MPGNEFRPAAEAGLFGGIALALVMGKMSRRQNINSDWSLFLVVAALTTAGFLAVTAVSNPARPNDDWRRTAAGWQRAAAWPISVEHPVALSKPSFSGVRAAKIPRLDTHPAVLAFMQLVGVLAALRVFTAPAPQSLRDWRTLLMQSFRASAFGS